MKFNRLCELVVNKNHYAVTWWLSVMSKKYVADKVDQIQHDLNFTLRDSSEVPSEPVYSIIWDSCRT